MATFMAIMSSATPTTGAAVLSDFGAASVLPTTRESEALQRIEIRAWGLLFGELLERCTNEPSGLAGLCALQSACVNPDPGARPLMSDVLTVFARCAASWRLRKQSGGTRGDRSAPAA